MSASINGVRALSETAVRFRDTEFSERTIRTRAAIDVQLQRRLILITIKCLNQSAVGFFERVAQSRQVFVAQNAARFLQPEQSRRFFACGLALQKLLVMRRFQIQEVCQLVNVQRNLCAIDIDQIWDKSKSRGFEKCGENV